MNTSIVQKLWLFSGLFFLLLVAQMILIVSLTSEIKGGMTSNEEVVQPMTNSFHQLQISVIQTQQWLTDISATRALNGLDDGFAEAEASAKLFTQALQQLIRLDPSKAESYRSLIPVYQSYYQTGQKMAHSYIDSGPEGGNKVMAEFDGTAAAIYEKIDDFVEAFNASNTKRLLEQRKDSEKLETYNYIFFLAYFILLGILIFGGINFVTRPARKLVEALQEIASGDLSHILQINRKDELGDIAQTTNNIVNELGGVLQKVSSQGMLISAYSQATVLIVHDTADGIDRQEEHANEIVQVISGMNDSVEKIDRLSTQAQEKAIHANSEANSGKAVVDQSIMAINSLASDLRQAEQSIQSLEKSGGQISTVLNVIQEIAEQTNLLALNAAIEAARAGEQGRGFAVVADEVRTLAARTQGSAQEIKSMIEELQKGTKEAVKMMDKSHSQVQSNVEKSEKAGSSLQAIADAVEQISQMNNQIADATSDQKAVSQAVNSTITEIVKLVEDVKQKSVIASKMGEETRRQASDFTSLVTDIKV